jgi:hypothetical protein
MSLMHACCRASGGAVARDQEIASAFAQLEVDGDDHQGSASSVLADDHRHRSDKPAHDAEGSYREQDDG